MNNLIARGSLLAVCLVSITVASCQSSSFHNPQTVSSTNKDRDWHVNFLKGRISFLQPAEGGVKITGRVFQSLDVETHTVPVGHRITIPDHHGSKVYTITAIQDDGAVIEYESTFDHRSFGKNIIERDTGTFILTWFESAASTRPAAITLSGAIDDWVLLIEADKLKEASQRWSKDDEAAEQMAERWEALNRCHRQFDYRNWVRQAQTVVNPNEFTVGGHSYGFIHTVWVPTPSGWRIARVFICR